MVIPAAPSSSGQRPRYPACPWEQKGWEELVLPSVRGFGFPSHHLQLIPLATRWFGVGAAPNNLMESSGMRGRKEKNPAAPRELHPQVMVHCGSLMVFFFPAHL